MRPQWYLVLALLVGLLSGLYVYSVLRQAGLQEPVVVLAHDVPAFTRLAAGDLRVVRVPAGSRQPGTFSDPGEVVGYLSPWPLFEGEQLTEPRLKGGEAGALAGLGPDHVIASIPLNPDRAPLDLLEPGSRVAVVVVRKSDWQEGGYARLLLDDVLVLRLHQKSGAFTQEEEPTHLLVQVDPYQAAQLALAQSQGEIYVVVQGLPGPLAEAAVDWQQMGTASVPESESGEVVKP